MIPNLFWDVVKLISLSLREEPLLVTFRVFLHFCVVLENPFQVLEF